MSSTVHYRGFDGSVIQDAEEELFHGRILGIDDWVIYDGATQEEAERVFREAVDHYIASFERDARAVPRPFGNYPAALSRELLLRAALYAHEHETTTDEVLTSALLRYLAPVPELAQAA